jgi:hypothetical protein
LSLQAEILSYSRARGAFVGASIDGSSISLDTASDAAFYQPPGTIPAAATQLVQLLSTLSRGGAPTVSAPSQPASPAVVPMAQAPNELEATRQQLDASSRQLAADLDNQWQQYLALPAEIYIPNHTPNIEAIEQAIQRYEQVSQQPQYAALTAQPAFQETLKGLRRLGELRHGAQKGTQIPPPPLGAN